MTSSPPGSSSSATWSLPPRTGPPQVPPPLPFARRECRVHEGPDPDDVAPTAPCEPVRLSTQSPPTPPTPWQGTYRRVERTAVTVDDTIIDACIDDAAITAVDNVAVDDTVISPRNR